VKSTKPQGKDKGREEKTNTSKIVDTVRSNLTYYGGEIDLSNPLINEFLQKDTNGLQEISFNKLTMNNPNFYSFSQSHQ